MALRNSISIDVRKVPAQVALVLLAYTFIFQPPIVNKYFVITFELLVFLLFFAMRRQFVGRVLAKFKVEILLAVALLAIAISRDLLSAQVVYSDRFAAWLFQSLIFPIFLVFTFFKGEVWSNKKVQDLPKEIYFAMLLAAVSTLMLYAIPTLDAIYQSIAIDEVFENYRNFSLRYRAYGISENLNFTYGYLMGVFGGVSFLEARKRPIFFIPAIIFTVALALNSRIGFLPLIILIVYSRSVFGFVGFGILIGLLYLVVSANGGINEMSVEWVSSFFLEFRDIFFGGANASSATLETIFNDFVIFPVDYFSWFFGTGQSLYGLEVGSSDIGYILQLNYGGMMLLMPISILTLFLIIRVFRTLGYRHWFAWIFSFSVVFLNTKGFFFAATPGSRLLFFLYLYFLSSKKFMHRNASRF